MRPLRLAAGLTAACLTNGLPVLARPVAAPPAILRIFVSPSGSDAGSGEQTAPVATLEAARDIARAHPGPDEIVLRGGDYHLSRPVLLDAADSGLRIVAAAGERPILHGGPRLSRWRREGEGLWSAELPSSGDSPVADLFVGGKRQVQARYPNADRAEDGRGGWLFAAPQAPGPDGIGKRQFRFRAGDLPPIEGVGGLVAHIVGGGSPGMQWGSDTLPVTAIDRRSRTVHTEGTDYFQTGEGSRYFLSGRREFLDAPGEWWFDAAARRLLYRPRSDTFDGTAAVAGILPTLLQVEGASDVTISGLGFENGAPQGTGKFGTDTRGGGAIRLERADRARLLDNSFENLGVAIHVAESADVLIDNNEISGTAGNAIYLGTSWGSFGRSDRAVITNNRIADVGRDYFESAAIWFQAADDVRIAHNLIERTAQFGIAGGSIWGAQDACHRSLIEFNVVRDANRRTGDGGAIKLMGAQGDRQDSIIRHNLVGGTDQLMNRPDGTFWPPRYENTEEWPGPISWAIYLDGRASGVAITGNLLRGNVAGIGINGGWSNLVSGNVVADGTGAAFRFDDATGRGWRPDLAAPNRVERNVVLAASGADRVVDIHAPDHGSTFVAFADNLYWGALGPKSFRAFPVGGTGDLDQFRLAGWATGDRIADPGLATAADGGYALAGTSAAARLGIDLAPLRRAGPTDRPRVTGAP
ncbi:right-handed parallel beta-helix repeat-containing protein [Antarcticirhabdus aurantiaca]|uniref:Right-handed parallel beta-helix repeat-containing protein n=1 Tax=Antarcticirhabdus aurantiaca TaxID=2606717 RepID=A0ACD4NMJ4_9HYPH|nr:right-handed parallel beta-helix repeat-containing protein [Antarcticirhabdus aurantiaca]WAJ27947.1 right-handed parallel beta-helix repeat-containing protein [Jeongeuplla avenae]